MPARAAGITPPQIEAWLAAALGAGGCRVAGPVAARDNSRLFYAECSGSASPMAVKLCLKPRSDELDPDTALHQHDTLLRVHRAMGERSDLSVPKPLLVIPEYGLVATEWIAGKNLAMLLFSWGCGFARARDLVSGAGRWLRRFHACRVLAPGRLDAHEKLAFVSKLAAAHPVDDPIFQQALTTLRASADAAARPTLERSWVHGDFTADNVMVSGARTLGIDVDVRHENTVIHDLAPFLNHLELRALHPGGWLRAFSLPSLRGLFLHSYFDKKTEEVAVPLAWLRLCMLLQTWISARRKAGSPLRARFADLSHRAVVSRVAGGLGAR